MVPRPAAGVTGRSERAPFRGVTPVVHPADPLSAAGAPLAAPAAAQSAAGAEVQGVVAGAGPRAARAVPVVDDIRSDAELPLVSAPAKTVASVADPAIAAVNAGVVEFFERISGLLSGLPAGPVSDFLSGALLLVRRTLFNQLPTAEPVQRVVTGLGLIEGVLNAVDPEGDRLSYSLLAAPQHGTVQITDDGKYLYTPNNADDGGTYDTPDEFTVGVSDSGFNVLNPFGSRVSQVRVVAGGQGLTWPGSQGFGVLNMTNSVVWLTHVDYDNPGAMQDSCSKQGFCADKAVGTILKPGDTFHFELQNINSSLGWSVWLDFSAPDLEAGGPPSWRVRAGNWLYDRDTLLSRNFITLCDRSPQQKCSGANPDPQWRTGGFDLLGGGMAAPSADDSRLLVLQTVDPGYWDGDAPTPARYDIGPDYVWSTSPPAWCSSCKPAVDKDGKPLLNAFTTLQNLQGLWNKYPKTLTTKYAPGYYDQSQISYSGGSTAIIRNTTPNRPAQIEENWTVTSNPGPPPDSPWWQKYAAQGAEALAKNLLGRFLPESITGFISSAIGKKLSPEEAKAPIEKSGKLTLTPEPYSFTAILVRTNKHRVNGDVTMTLNDSPTITPFGNRGNDYVIYDKGAATFNFSNVSFDVQNPDARFDAEVFQEPLQPVDQKTGLPQRNVGFRVFDEAQRKDAPVYFLDGWQAAGSQPVRLYLTAFDPSTGPWSELGKNYSARGCTDGSTLGCTTFSVDNADVAEVSVDPGTGYGQLVLKGRGTALVTARYEWAFPQTGSVLLPAEKQYVLATMRITVN